MVKRGAEAGASGLTGSILAHQKQVGIGFRRVASEATRARLNQGLSGVELADFFGAQAAPAKRLAKTELQCMIAPGLKISLRKERVFSYGCGCSSAVEHDLAKVGVASSILVARSN
jgi:hypothetical protein